MSLDPIKKEEGKKDDAGKPRWNLIPLNAVEEIVKVMTFGAKKYGDNNWKLVDKNRFVAAMMRHLTKIMSGNKIDDESGLLTAAHLACNALFILFKEMEENDTLF